MPGGDIGGVFVLMINDLGKIVEMIMLYIRCFVIEAYASPLNVKLWKYNYVCDVSLAVNHLFLMKSSYRGCACRSIFLIFKLEFVFLFLCDV